MLLKLCAIFAFLKISSALDGGHEWDLAVATNGHIELLAANGTLIGTAREGFAKLKALTFDNIRHRFIVSDMDEYNNDTIYAIDLTKETDDNPIIADLPDDVQGLAIDPIDDILYWTDMKNKTINFISLKDDNPQTQILFAFEQAWPQDIAVDICRRYIYWTNSYRRKPSIERAKIGSQKSEIIVDSDLGLPAGITVDYRTRRIYWADMRGGIYFRIESTNLEGKERQIIYEGINSEPFAVAIKNEFLYFTDLRRNALWKFDLKAKTQPKRIRSFDEKPMGLIAKKKQIRTLPDCQLLEQVYENYTSPVVENFEVYKEDETVKKEMQCINGTMENGVCKCSRGYSGVFCELSLCHNYCLVGSCHLTSQGYPYCHCPKGSGGPRCERDCEGYCMNGGLCSYGFSGEKLPNCSCPKGYKGPRCEENEIVDSLCDFYCSQQEIDDSRLQDPSFCKCDKRNYDGFKNQSPQALLASEGTSSYMNYLQDPVFISLGCITLTALLACMVLTVYVVYLRRKPNPKIKRRYIVNKNPSTSMTERPHAQQCEITIENCCNMNICETPCYEPPRLQKILSSRNEDKKMLLSNMEKVEDY
ncbi:protein cueball [Coccinella septempunctata]|uniref:protein cueball n=1 Tax=Coccinella septempunctata TaxID=41139 RepID=UPI001D090836|nr:protein cueball [Coccinella septempunctata]